MGVPAFFRWLSRKYPSIVVHCVEDKIKVIDGQSIPIDSSLPNPNNVEFDNLYLDMNGIIHPCCHPENKAAPKNEDEMMVAIFEYIDRIFAIVRPRRLLYMAIDGVAPRAKMNQQRSRRFRASKETAEKVDEIHEIRERLLVQGAYLPPEKPKEEHFDSNCITPGTPFMDRLAKCLHYYIHDRLNTDPGWKNIQVILSDANVPGEGEHKIMDYIRKQRANPSHDPNTHHCLCGADADLIMLGLATHEPQFTIIREEFKPNQPRPCEICGQIGHEMKDCTGAAKEKQGEFDELEKPMAAETEFIFIRLSVLREYLERDLSMPNLPFTYDFERCIDDWVFMCFFVGNDFLPHLPSLEIREGAIDRLVRLYKTTVYRTGGYLTDSGLVNLTRVQLIMTELGEVEDEIFKRRQERELDFRRRNKEKNKRMKKSADRPAWTPSGQFAPSPIGSRPSPISNPKQEAHNMRVDGMQRAGFGTSATGNVDAASALRVMLKDGKVVPSPPTGSDTRGDKRKHDDDSDESEEEPEDEVRLWEDGFKDRYYTSKFEVSADNIPFRHTVAAAYTLGLCWVLRYYYQGCASWKWYFPYHYAPFASDFINIGDLPSSFEKGTQPFNPLEQLMGVFPAASRNHVPPSWGELMIDSESAIIDFYPDDFKVDLNGKKFAWQGVALLPFVDEKRLLSALSRVYPLLSKEEQRRNVRGDDRLYVRKGHEGYDLLIGFYEAKSNWEKVLDMDASLFYGMMGTVLLTNEVVAPGDTLNSPVIGVDSIQNNVTACVKFRDPKYDEDFIFPAKRLLGAKEPNRVLKPGDLNNERNRNWRPQIGMAPARQRASLDISGMRTLRHNMHGSYGNFPPPQNLYNQSRWQTPYQQTSYHRSNEQQQQWSSPGYDRGRGDAQSNRSSGYQYSSGNNWGVPPNHNQPYRQDNNYQNQYQQGGQQPYYRQNYGGNQSR